VHACCVLAVCCLDVFSITCLVTLVHWHCHSTSAARYETTVVCARPSLSLFDKLYWYCGFGFTSTVAVCFALCCLRVAISSMIVPGWVSLILVYAPCCLVLLLVCADK
jgi:hypothetical protein